MEKEGMEEPKLADKICRRKNTEENGWIDSTMSEMKETEDVTGRNEESL